MGKQLSIEKLLNPQSFLHFALIWTTFIYAVRWSWYVGGAFLMVLPIYASCLIIYNLTQKKRKLPFFPTLIVSIYYLYIFIIHILHRDIAEHGAGDFYCFAFILVCLLSGSKEEYVERFVLVCKTMLYISIVVGIASIICSELKITNYSAIPSMLRNTIQAITDGYDEARKNGLMGNPNSTGHWCAYGLMFGTVVLFLNPHSLKYKLLFIIDLLLTIYILVITGSRAALLSILIFAFLLLLFYFLYLKKYLPSDFNKFINYVVITIIILIFLILIFFIISNNFSYWVLSFLRIPFSENSSTSDLINSTLLSFKDASNRGNLRQYSIQAWKDNPIFGISTSNLILDYFEPGSTINTKNGSHHLFIQLLATTGIIGFILHIAIWASSIIGVRLAFKVSKKNKEVDSTIINTFTTIMLIVILIDNLFEVYLYTSITIMALLGFFVLSNGLVNLNRNIKDEKDHNN